MPAIQRVKFCLMLERIHDGQHNIYTNRVLIYTHLVTSPIVNHLSVGSRIRIDGSITGANYSSNVYYCAALLRQLTDTERIQYVEALREVFKIVQFYKTFPSSYIMVSVFGTSLLSGRVDLNTIAPVQGELQDKVGTIFIPLRGLLYLNTSRTGVIPRTYKGFWKVY